VLVSDLRWSRLGGADRIRLAGLGAACDVQVRPAARRPAAELPPMAGSLVPDGPDLCFVPRFRFTDGIAYTVWVGGAVAGVLHRPRPDRPATTRVAAIRPSAARVPRNLLRCYVHFSAPMSEGSAAAHLRLTADDGTTLDHALLAGEELWDAGHRRLTVLLDPARIKRGLAGHRALGYPLQPGQPVRLVVGAGFRDAAGAPLLAGADRRYQVGPDERRRVEPGEWTLDLPAAGTRQAVRAAFGRPLDDALLGRCLHVTDPDGQEVTGAAAVGPQQRSWSLIPARPWTAGPYRLVIDPVLEDLAGNSVSRVFDRDLTRPADDPRPPGPVTVPFRPR
jgi:hypothetical protein